MRTLIWAEFEDASLKDATLAAISAGRRLGTVDLLVTGDGVQGAAEAASRVAGVELVHVADDPGHAHVLPETIAPLVATLMADYDYFLVAATANGKNIAPRVAALLDVMQISDVTSVEPDGIFMRPIYAGNAIASVRSRDSKVVVTVRGTAFEKAVASGGAASLRPMATPALDRQSRFVGEELSQSERPELTSAKVVVSGGRALASGENFRQILEPLADKLGAALGASRAAVDSGYVPNDYQVGQTGKVVAPEVYIAVGISGAIQHLAGMKDSKTIIAINKDADAPIFQVADIGLVGDLFQLVPELTSKI